MCTILFAYKAHPKFDFVFLGNRDEFKKRSSLGAHFWLSHPNLLAGLDSEKGGTWTGITKEGRIAFLTNYRDPLLQKESTLSRGYLTRNFLISSVSPKRYLQDIQLQRTSYNPYNLVVGNFNELWFYSNVENHIRTIKPGIYGLSNALLNTPWFKVRKAKSRLTHLLNTDFSLDQLFDILDDTEVPPDEELPKTGIPLETERMLSTIYIDTPIYGTLFKTVILVTTQGNVYFYEKTFSNDGHWHLSTYNFDYDVIGK